MDVITSHNKKREYDFVFVCESKVRELESCCLIGQELENRGYSVGIINWWMPQIYIDYEPVSAKVLMSHAIYKDESLNRELAYIDGSTKVINMQWEQIYSIRELTSDLSPWKMEGRAKRVIHLSWGENNYKKLVEYDLVSKENIKVVGSVTMDYLQPKLRDYFISREGICNTYNIPNNEKICLFISSFSLVNLPENIQEDEFKDIWELQIRSQKEVLKWIDELLDKRSDITFVYRPHPAEADNELLKKMEKKYRNFRCIRDLSVKQWIVVSDVIYNWFSTSIAEIYFAGKNCHILRPIQLPDDIEVTILENGRFITNCDTFLETIDSECKEFPIPIENVKNSYKNKRGEMVYLRIADTAEEIINSDSELFCTSRMYDKKELVKYKLKATILGRILLLFKHALDSLKEESKEDRNNRDYEHYVREMYEKNDFTQEDLDNIYYRIKHVLGEDVNNE